MPTNNPRGRPPKISEEIILGICELIQEGNFLLVACRRYGLSQRTVYRWMLNGKKFPDGLYGLFRQMTQEAQAVAEVEAVKMIMAVGRTIDPRQLNWWLERKFPQRWGRYRGELTELKKEIRALRRMLQGDETAYANAPGEGEAA